MRLKRVLTKLLFHLPVLLSLWLKIVPTTTSHLYSRAIIFQFFNVVLSPAYSTWFTHSHYAPIFIIRLHCSSPSYWVAITSPDGHSQKIEVKNFVLSNGHSVFTQLASNVISVNESCILACGLSRICLCGAVARSTDNSHSHVLMPLKIRLSRIEFYSEC